MWSGQNIKRRVSRRIEKQRGKVNMATDSKKREYLKRKIRTLQEENKKLNKTQSKVAENLYNINAHISAVFITRQREPTHRDMLDLNSWIGRAIQKLRGDIDDKKD